MSSTSFLDRLLTILAIFMTQVDSSLMWHQQPGHPRISELCQSLPHITFLHLSMIHFTLANIIVPFISDLDYLKVPLLLILFILIFRVPEPSFKKGSPRTMHSSLFHPSLTRYILGFKYNFVFFMTIPTLYGFIFSNIVLLFYPLFVNLFMKSPPNITLLQKYCNQITPLSFFSLLIRALYILVHRITYPYTSKQNVLLKANISTF